LGKADLVTLSREGHLKAYTVNESSQASGKSLLKGP